MDEQTNTPIVPIEPEAPAPTIEPKFAEIEALLFFYGEPMALDRIAKLLEVKRDVCRELIDRWSAALSLDAGRGLMLLQNGDTVQLVTKPSLKVIGEKLVKEEFREELTPAGLETLSLIAYLGPITRPRIDYIRGVNSSFIVRNLLMRGLIERTQSAEKGHLFEYRTSVDFLKHMGVSGIRELPEYERYHAMLTEFEAQRTESARIEEQPRASEAPAEPVPAEMQ
jgi:segregation and condensation protein B